MRHSCQLCTFHLLLEAWLWYHCGTAHCYTYPWCNTGNYTVYCLMWLLCFATVHLKILMIFCPNWVCHTIWKNVWFFTKWWNYLLTKLCLATVQRILMISVDQNVFSSALLHQKMHNTGMLNRRLHEHSTTLGDYLAYRGLLLQLVVNLLKCQQNNFDQLWHIGNKIGIN